MMFGLSETNPDQSDSTYNDHIITAKDINGVTTVSGSGYGGGSVNGLFGVAYQYGSGSSVTQETHHGTLTIGYTWNQDYATNTVSKTQGVLRTLIDWTTGSDPITTTDTSLQAPNYFANVQGGIALPEIIPLSLTFNTLGSLTFGQIGNPTVTSVVTVTPVPIYGTVVPSDSNKDYTPPKWESTAVWTCRGISAVCFVWAGALVAGGYAGLSVGNGLLVSGYNVVSAGVRVYYTAAGAAASLLCYVNNLGCFRAGTLVLASKGLEPIETIRLGRRVLTSPGDQSGPAIEPAEYRMIRLSFVRDGQEVRMSFLRPASSVEGLGAGDTIQTSILELRVRGTARVIAVDPCPPIEDGPGSVVTGAFSSESVDVLRIRLQGLEEPIEVTGIHPIYSEDRLAFVPASSLCKGERLRTRGGTAVIKSIEREHGGWEVYNLEVHGAHRYYVTEQQVLVHNAGGGDCGAEEAAEQVTVLSAEAQAAVARMQEEIDAIETEGIPSKYIAEWPGVDPDYLIELFRNNIKNIWNGGIF